MVKIFRAAECELLGLGGYGRKYVADIVFRKPLSSAGLILVKIPGGVETAPHSHEHLEEAFIIMSKTRLGVDQAIFDLEEGDVALAEPGEQHWFVTPEGDDVTIIAIKFPNLKDDKIVSE